jgi:hypothetical protein
LSKLRIDLLKKIDKLNTIFETTVITELTNNGIAVGNVSKAGISIKTIKNLLLEQKETLTGIVHQLESSIKAKIYYLKNRGSEKLLDIGGNIKTSIPRIKSMAEYGIRNAIANAERDTRIFLYGDPLSKWVTAGDDKVCEWCEELEYDNPQKLSDLPLTPLHPNCRCKIENYKDDLELTKNAKDLFYYDT